MADDLGKRLSEAAAAWQAEFRETMTGRGFAWHRTAAGDVLAYLERDGMAQTVLTARMGLSKQAVQQLLDQLEKDGVIARVPDTQDKRAKRIVPTELGLADLDAGRAVRLAIEERYREVLGKKLYSRLEKALKRLPTT